MADPIQGHTTALVSTLNPPQYVLAEIFCSMTSTTQKSLVPGDVALFSSGHDATNPLCSGQNTPSGTDPTSHWRPFRSWVAWGQFSFPCPAALGFLSWFPVPCCLRSSQPSHHWCLSATTLPKWDLLCALPVGGNPPPALALQSFLSANQGEELSSTQSVHPESSSKDRHLMPLSMKIHLVSMHHRHQIT